jgi:hypothetical protein
MSGALRQDPALRHEKDEAMRRKEKCLKLAGEEGLSLIGRRYSKSKTSSLFNTSRFSENRIDS